MSTATAFRTYLDAVHAVLNGGDALDAERVAKAISVLVRAERDVAEFMSEARSAGEHDESEAIRAELQRRLALLADADRAGSGGEVLAAIAATGSAP
ncbi:MAG: hypothetical protein R3C31_14390 [Hyphomonadaceae bacterium]